MATRRMESELVIRATDAFSKTLREANKATGRFAEQTRKDFAGLRELRGPVKLVGDFRKAQAQTKATREQFKLARLRLKELKTQIGSTDQPTAKMRKEFSAAERVAKKLGTRWRQQRVVLSEMKPGLREAGINTNRLGDEYSRLTTQLDKANRAFGRQMERLRDVDAMQRKLREARGYMDRTLATSANMSFVGGASTNTGRRILQQVSTPVTLAVDFETAMADVRKVVDFDSDDGFAAMSKDILELSTRIPMAADGIAQIVAAGGQSGIAREDLAQFAEMAAKIGVAFDITAESSGESMAKIKTALGLTLNETGLLFDAMNHLSNNMASTAPDVLNFMNRSGAAGQGFGFDPTETMAIGSAMIAAGAQADVAATSFRNVGAALTKGEAATKAQSTAFAKLGLDAVDIAQRMQEDAEGTILMVFERLNEVPEAARAATISQLFGNEARAITPLIGNLDLLRQSFAEVADVQNFAGSAEEEYAVRSQTTANNMALMRNQLAAVGISIGSVVLPVVNDLLAAGRKIVASFAAWSERNPELTKTLVIAAGALGGLAVVGGTMLTAAAGLVGTFAVLRFGMSALTIRTAFAARGLGTLARGFRGLRRLSPLKLGSLVRPLTWTSSMLPAVPWSDFRARSGKFGMNSKGWGRLITPLKWFGRGTLRLIPVIGWAVMAAKIGMFAWSYLGLNKLPWKEWIDKIDWGFWFSFKWQDELPPWRWGDIIPPRPEYWSNETADQVWWTANGRGSILGAWGAGIEKANDFRAGEITKEDLQTWLQREAREGVWPRRAQAMLEKLNEPATYGAPEKPAGWRGAQRRASGGAFGLGPLIVGERGMEALYASRSGFVANNTELRSMARMSSSIMRAGANFAATATRLPELNRAAQRFQRATIATVAATVIANQAAAEERAREALVPAPNPPVVAQDHHVQQRSVEVHMHGGFTVMVQSGDPNEIARVLEKRLADGISRTLDASFADGE